MRFAIVSSSFNPEISDGLLKGALEYFQEKSITLDQVQLFQAPGAFEIPLIAKTLAKSGNYSGVICLGSVIKGETAHFEFISLGATVGMMQAMLDTEIPISFGILTVYEKEQARQRSLSDAHNKGREAANACLQTLETLKSIHEPLSENHSSP